MNGKSLGLLVLMLSAMVIAATPPGLINYQGVVRNASGVPLSGNQDMVFKFHSASSGGDEILIDAHTAANGNPVAVSNGLFTAQFGGGTVSDGSGPGSYTDLGSVFRDYGTVYVAITVAGEILNPRVQVISSAYALNADHLDGLNSAAFAAASHAHSGTDITSGTVAEARIDAAIARDTEIMPTVLAADGPGSTLNADLLDGADSTAFAAASHNHAASNITSGTLGVARGGTGVSSAGALGNVLTSNGTAWVSATPSAAGLGAVVDAADATLTRSGSGTTGAPYKLALNLGNANAWTAKQTFFTGSDYGIEAKGSSGGGLFYSNVLGTWTAVAYGNSGIQAQGYTTGGVFTNGLYSGEASLADGHQGIRAYGDSFGGYFEDSDSGSYAYVAYGNQGIEAYGSGMGGWFEDTNGSGYAFVGFGDWGIDARGNTGGGYFKDRDGSGFARAGYHNTGIDAEANDVGGYFADLNSSIYSRVAYDTYKISGTGTVSFVQNHPEESGRVIVYAAPEGDEVATYTRGSARLADGEARVQLGETFRWVTNPDLGLTVHLTPVGEWADLYVAEKSTTELVVRSRDGASGAAFDYIVYGLRIGFEEIAIVQEKIEESYIPSFKEHRERYVKYPELQAYSPIERFTAMECSLRGVDRASLDLSAAAALRDAVHEYDPATDPPVHELFGRPPGPEASPERPEVGRPEAETLPHAREWFASAERRPSPFRSAAPASDPPSAAATPPPAETDAIPAPGALSLFTVKDAVERGDILVLNPANGDELFRCFLTADPMVVGIAAEEAPALGQLRVVQYGTTWVKADATTASISRGDLLVASPTLGHAMKAPKPAEQGTVIGKALEPLQVGTGMIKVLVMLR